MTFKNDLELFEALVAGETVVRTDEFNYIQFKLVNGDVNKSYDSGKTWDNLPVDVHSSFLAIKQKTLQIGKFEVPEPIRKELTQNKTYYTPVISLSKIPFEMHYWSNSDEDMYNLKAGLIHLSAENAQKHADAIISLSRIDI